jgi:anthranilate phosphoribosyltransferase
MAPTGGADGLDEISTTGNTTVFQVEAGRVQKRLCSPADFDMETASIEQLRGGDPETNAGILRAVLDGDPGPKRDIVLANAAAALLVAHRAPDLKSAVTIAAEAIDSGRASEKLNRLIEFASQFRHEVV